MAGRYTVNLVIILLSRACDAVGHFRDRTRLGRHAANAQRARITPWPWATLPTVGPEVRLLGVRALGFRSLSFDQSSGMIYLQK